MNPPKLIAKHNLGQVKNGAFVGEAFG